MSESFDLEATSRADAGKGASRRLRSTGMVPGIVYGGQQDPVMISVVHSDLIHQLESESFYSQVLELKLDGKLEKVVLKDLQRHPAKPFATHIDFQRVRADEKLRMLVPLHFLQEEVCPGVKGGGIVSHNINEVEVTCLPKDLPEYIDVDMSQLDIHQSVHVSELVMPEGVELDHTLDPQAPVVSIHAAAKEEDEEGEEEGEGLGEGPAVEE